MRQRVAISLYRLALKIDPLIAIAIEAHIQQRAAQLAAQHSQSLHHVAWRN